MNPEPGKRCRDSEAREGVQTDVQHSWRSTEQLGLEQSKLNPKACSLRRTELMEQAQPSVIVLKYSTSKGSVLHFFRCFLVSAVTQLLKAH